jgi:hypothetical protein
MPEQEPTDMCQICGAPLYAGCEHTKLDVPKSEMHPWAQAKQDFDNQVKEKIDKNPELANQPPKYEKGEHVLIPGPDGKPAVVEIQLGQAGVYLAQFDTHTGIYRPVVCTEDEIQSIK